MERSSRLIHHFQRYLSSKCKVLTKLHKVTLATSNLPKKCWKCDAIKTNSNLFCERCHAIQAPEQKSNYFKLLGVEETFNIDQKAIKDKFRKFQSFIHPDKFSNRSQEEQAISEEYSSLINKAYSSLMSPMKRAEHLLHLQGQSVQESETVDDPGFLLKIMELNEEVEEAQNDIDKLKTLDKKNKLKLERLTEEIDQYFKSNKIEDAKKCIVKLKYFNSIDIRINSIFRAAGVTD